MIALATILSAIQAGVTLIPEGEALVSQLAALMSTDDQATIDAALVASRTARDAQHAEAQSL